MARDNALTPTQARFYSGRPGNGIGVLVRSAPSPDPQAGHRISVRLPATGALARQAFAWLLATALLWHTADGRSEPTKSAVLVAGADLACPYTCDPDSSEPGALVELLREIFQPYDITIDYRIIPWPRALTGASAGEIQFVPGVVAGRPGILEIGRENVGEDEAVLVSRRDDEFQYTDPANLEGLRIGLVAGYSYANNPALADYLASRLAANKAVVVIHRDNPLESLLAMLANGRIDVFVSSRAIAEHDSERLGYRERISLHRAGPPDRLYIGVAVTAGSEAYLAMLDQGITRLKRSGRLEQIYRRYGLGSAGRSQGATEAVTGQGWR